jgi:hypothetical protein
MVLARGMMKAFEKSSKRESRIPPIQYERINRFKLIPDERTGINSDLLAILEVKKITEMKTNKGKSSAMIWGMNPI